MALRMIAAFYGKKYCSFVPPWDNETNRRDVYYFPDGAAFCSNTKPTGFMAASVLKQNPECRMVDKSKKKAKMYLVSGFTIGDVAVDRGGRAAAKAPALTSGASSSASGTMKRPAAPPVPKKKQKGPENKEAT